VDYILTNLVSWPEPDRDPDCQLFFEKKFGLVNCNLLFIGQRGISVVAVAIVSSKPDSLVKTISDQVKEAADQCSGTRPALIASHLVDQIDRSELQTLLRTSSGFHTVAAQIFESEKRSHVDSIAFTVPQRLRLDGAGSRSLSGDLAAVYNPHPKFPDSEIRTVFRP
jgi:hypothetical protein